MRKVEVFELLRAPSPIVDIGINIAHPDFSPDFDSILARCVEANVKMLIATGTSFKSSQTCLEVIKRDGPVKMWSTAGVHPHDAKNYDARVENLMEDAVAVGECGLDFDRNFSPPSVQMDVFRRQLRRAVALKKPVFLHQRLGFDEFNAIMDEIWPAEMASRACVHCFTGDAKELKHYVAKGYFVGITGFVCNANRASEMRSALSQGLLPVTQLLIETDGPFMSPLRKHRRCEPAMLPYVARELAQLMKVDWDVLCQQTTRNAEIWLDTKLS